MNENMETTPTAEITAEATPMPTDIPTPTPTAIPTDTPTPAPTPLPDTEIGAEIIVEDTDTPIPTETTEAEETEAEIEETETEEQTTAEATQTVIEFPEQIDANIINEPIAIEQIQPFEIEQTEALTVKEEYTIMDKPLTEYTPTEGLLLLILFVLLFRMIFDYGRRDI